MTQLEGHPITVVSERTGLTPDVLRVWERRYGAVRPARGPGGQRMYTDADIARLRLLEAATRAGRGIRLVAQLPTAELEAIVADDAAAREERSGQRRVPGIEAVIDEALELARKLASPDLEALLRRALARYGLIAFLQDLAAPFLRRLGDEWHAGRLSPAQEHLASSVVQDVIAEMMRAFSTTPSAPRIVVATLGGDRHVLGAAMVGVTAAAEGWQVVFLGADLPAADIALAARTAQASVIAISMIFVEDLPSAARELESVRAAAGDAAVWIGGPGASGIDERASGVHRFATLDDLREGLSAHRLLP